MCGAGNRSTPDDFVVGRIEQLAEAEPGMEHVPGHGYVEVRPPPNYEEAKRIVDAYERKKRLAEEKPLTKKLRTYDLPTFDAILNGEGKLLAYAMSTMTIISHGISVVRGWHDDPVEDGTRIALMHSELSEMLEGVRKDSMDDHIPTRKTEEVEAADLLIRLLDHCGKNDLDLFGAYFEKSLYNIKRKDHSKEERAKEGGKKF